MKKLITILALATLISCNKENEEGISHVVYDCYTEQGNATLKYVDKDGNWIETQITQKNYTVTIKQIEDNYYYVTQLKSTGADSLHIIAIVDGKSVENSTRSSGGSNNVSIQLTQLR